MSGDTGHTLALGVEHWRDARLMRVHRARPRGGSAVSRTGSEAWYHADFCHAYAWVYKEGDHLRVKWGERGGENLYLHARRNCDRCSELLARVSNAARHGEFTMAKPDAKFSSTEAFFTVLAEIAEYVPGLLDENGAGEGSRPSLPVAPDGPAVSGEVER